MSDISDSVEEFNEGSEELQSTVEDVLEDQTGIEWSVTNITDREEIDRIDIKVQPTGAIDGLVDELGEDVSLAGGGLSVHIQNQD